VIARPQLRWGKNFGKLLVNVGPEPAVLPHPS
jgi:hypothetical protein